jgi:hypothetical protein
MLHIRLKTPKTTSKKLLGRSNNVGGNDSKFKPDPARYALAAGMVYGSMIKRRNEQSINWYMLALGFFGLVILPYWWISSIIRKSEIATLKREERLAAHVLPTADGVSISAPELIPIALPTIPNNPIVIQVEYPTAQPTAQPSATPTPAAYSAPMQFRYSYYNPKLGGVNCALWDAALNDCMSTLATGEDWRTGYGSVIACPPDMALGTVLDVQYPPELQGAWTCKDRGGLIVGDFLDFLDVAQRVEWQSAVFALVYPPDTPLTQLSSGTH